MKYELAQHLKDAGFPLREIKAHDLTVRGLERGQISTGFIIDGRDYIEPTLSELIEACGEVTLTKVEGDTTRKSGWHAISKGMPLDDAVILSRWKAIVTEDKSPEEAVAKLYIALNKGK